MKYLFIFCAACCFAVVISLPLVYYTFLRIVISLASILMIYNFLKHKIYYWVILFTIILILFNPVFPIHLYRKSIWMPIDIMVGILFLLFAFLNRKDNEEIVETQPKEKTHKRDQIFISKISIKK